MRSKGLATALTVLLDLRSSSSLQGIARASTALRLLRSSVVLCATACSTSRKATEVSSSKLQVSNAESVDRVDSVVVELRDTLREITTITIDRNDKGDTLKLVQVTDRERLSSKADVRSQKVDVRVVRDTVYIQKDSLSVEDKKIGLSTSADGGSKKSGLSELFLCHDSGKPKRAWSLRSLLHRFLTYVKWICALVCAIVVLIITIKVCSLRR